MNSLDAARRRVLRAGLGLAAAAEWARAGLA
jgi:hypothetical protein